jgi:penicillin G amidase
MTTLQLAPSKPRAGRLKIALRIVIGLVLLIGLFVSITYYRWTRGPLPQIEGEIKLAGLKAPVTISRDSWGVAYITAGNLEDAIFAQGYTLAQDRLWQMDLLRRAASGELSEVLGPGNKDEQLELDKLYRSIGLRRIAAISLERLPEDLRRLLDAYARGVNSYIDTHRDQLPFEFRILGYEPAQWQPLDSLAIGKLMFLSLNTSWKRDLMRAELKGNLDSEVYKMLFDPRTDYDRPIVGEDLPAAEKPDEKTSETPMMPAISPELFSAAQTQLESASDLLLNSDVAMIGSNNWVVSGSRTSTGKPMLASDPHQGFTLPAIWHQVSLRVTDGSYHASGVALIGGPGIVIGHNEHIAWAMTNLMTDAQDLYVEEFDTDNSKRYRAGSEWREAEVIKEQIKVRKSMLRSETSTIDLEILITRHGPIIATEHKQKLAFKWTGQGGEPEFLALSKINRAQNWEEFCAALRIYPGPTQNFVFADVNGNIGYYGAGYIPVRSSGDGSLPYNGSSGEGEWERFIPFEELPHLYNPPGGFIQTANQRITGKNYPYHISTDWAPPYRAYRLKSVLSEKEKITVEEMQKLQSDVYSVPAHLFAEQALKMASAHQDDTEWRELQTELAGWDGKLTPESRPAAIASALREEFTERFLTNWLGRQRAVYTWFLRSLVIDRVILERSSTWLPKEYKDYDAMVIDSYRSAIKRLSNQLGADRGKWNYGTVNQLNISHPLAKSSILKWILDPPSCKPGGSPNTVSAVDTRADRIWGPTMRMVVSLADLDATTQSIMPGESGQFASKYYSDQINDWSVGHAHSFPFSEGAVEKVAAYRLTLAPKQ